MKEHTTIAAGTGMATSSTSTSTSTSTSSTLHRAIIEPTGATSGILDSIKIHGAVIATMAIFYPGDLGNYIADVESGNVRFSSPLPLLAVEMLENAGQPGRVDEGGKGENADMDGKCQFPMPLLPFTWRDEPGESSYTMLLAKLVKKRRWTSAGDALQMTSDGRITPGVARNIVGTGSWQARVHDTVPGVSINRLDSSSTIFYRERTWHRQPLCILFDPGDWEDQIKACLRFLGAAGISKHRSSGTGGFKLRKFDTVNINHDHHFNGNGLLISRFIPGAADLQAIDLIRSWISFKEIRGYTAAGRAIWGLRSLVEGSVIHVRRDQPDIGPMNGRVVHVGPGDLLVGTPLLVFPGGQQKVEMVNEGK